MVLVLLKKLLSIRTKRHKVFSTENVTDIINFLKKFKLKLKLFHKVS